MANERLNEIDRQLEVIRGRLEELAVASDPEGDEEVVRAALAERNDEVDDLTAAWDDLMRRAVGAPACSPRAAAGVNAVLTGEREPLIERARRLEDVLSAAKDVRRTEPGDGGRYLGGTGPEVMRRGDPFDTDLDLVRAGRGSAEDVISRAKRAVESAPRYVSDDGKHYLIGVLDREDNIAEGIARHALLTGSKAYHDEFRTYMQSAGRVAGPEITRALGLGSAAAGAALMPYTLDPTVILTNLGIAGSIRSLATVKQITTNAWHGVTSAGVTAEWLGEGAASADKTPADFADPNIVTYKAHAWVVGSYEALADTNFGEQLSMLVADAKNRLDEAAFAVGTGTSQPWGLVSRAVTTTASRVAAGTASAFAAADVFNVSAAASPRHASQSVWFANKSVYHKIRQFSTVTSGGAFWTDMGVGRPSQLLGAGTYEASAMDAYAANTTSTLLVLVNPKEYYVVDRVGLQLKYVDVVFGTGGTPTGNSGWEAFWRVGGDLVGPSASARVFRQFTSTAW